MTFAIYRPSPALEERIAGTAKNQLRFALEKLEEIKAATGKDFPGVEAILASSFSGNDTFLRETIRHDYTDESKGEFELHVNELTEDFLLQRIRSLPEDSALGLSSVCKLKDGSKAHLPLLDFRHSTGGGNDALVVKAVRAIGFERGFVVESGRSYHFYGLSTLDQDEWVSFLGRSLLLAPIIDVRYIAHRLIAGRCVVRISTSKLKPKMPFVKKALVY